MIEVSTNSFEPFWLQVNSPNSLGHTVFSWIWLPFLLLGSVISLFVFLPSGLAKDLVWRAKRMVTIITTLISMAAAAKTGRRRLVQQTATLPQSTDLKATRPDICKSLRTISDSPENKRGSSSTTFTIFSSEIIYSLKQVFLTSAAEKLKLKPKSQERNLASGRIFLPI